MALAVIAASLGNTLTSERESVAEKVISGPSIADMAAMAPAIGGDTMGASLRILEQLKAQARAG